MNSVMSFPNRGPWGDARWRGNSSGHVYRELFEQLKPSTFCDPMVGSGTSCEVAQEMGIRNWGLDIHRGFNAIKDSILEAIGQEVDIVFGHPPYHTMVPYANDPDDLSRCSSDEDFLQKMQLVMLNQREATRSGGYYGCLIGDYRRNGQYSSYQAGIICSMPKEELAAVIIKTQHNCVSDSRQYGRMKLPRILHEYLLLFEKRQAPTLVLLAGLAREQQARLTGTWKSILQSVMISLGGKATLKDIYEKVSIGAPEKMAANPHWREKLRQILQTNDASFRPVERGVWALV